jgi:hypothetical protein
LELSKRLIVLVLGISKRESPGRAGREYAGRATESSLAQGAAMMPVSYRIPREKRDTIGARVQRPRCQPHHAARPRATRLIRADVTGRMKAWRFEKGGAPSCRRWPGGPRTVMAGFRIAG